MICGPTAGRNDFLQISSEIPNRGIDLGQRDLHSSSLSCDLGRPDLLGGGLDPVALKDHTHGLRNDLQIQAHGPIVDVGQIERDIAFERRIVPGLRLP